MYYFPMLLIMISEEPKVSNNGRYTINQTCAILCICRDSLRKYTQLGLIRCGYRNTNNRPYYVGSEILRFWHEHL